MEHTPVIIVGAGPSGLVLALSLAKHKIHSIVLEKELAITDDPRGVYLSGDSVRILWDLGIQEDLSKIGHVQKGVQFHKGSLTNPAFISLDTQRDWRQQAVPDGIMQIQPELERTLEARINHSEHCQLRRGCEITAVEEGDKGVLVKYRDTSGDIQDLKGAWLVGADGKRGYVRKHYLEPIAGVIQERGLFAYEGTWIAANLHIRLPTPESHPDFAAWTAGLTPEEVYDLFWPEHLHFISPPGKPTASMRFGPTEARLWRHEFAEPDWNDSMDAEQLLWEHLLPMVTRECDNKGRRFGRATFPQDCIEIRRCAPYAFTQKVVNKWFHKRTILIGDAAHVFPPFGGQGITSGIRDAQGLAWRLAMFERMPVLSDTTVEKMLNAWSHERKQGIDDSARFTKANGDLANEEEKWTHALLRTWLSAVQKVPVMPHIQTDYERAEQEAYSPVKDGFFMPQQRGGRKIAQIYVQNGDGPALLSDSLLDHNESMMTLMVLGDADLVEVGQIIEESELPISIISKQSVVRIDCGKQSRDVQIGYRPCAIKDLPAEKVRTGYEPGQFAERLGRETKFVVLRPDFIIYSAAKDLSGLQRGLRNLKRHLDLDQ